MRDFFTQKRQVKNKGMKQDKQKKEKQERREENTNVNIMGTHSYESIYLKSFSVKIKASDGENFESFAFLDSGSRSTLKPVSLQSQFQNEF